jgi:hypothetical protein
VCPWSWFSQGTPASFITKTGRHDIAEKLLKVALNTNKPKMKKLPNDKPTKIFCVQTISK